MVRHTKTCLLCLSPLACSILDHSLWKLSLQAVRTPNHIYILQLKTPPELPANSQHQLPAMWVAILNIRPNWSFGWLQPSWYPAATIWETPIEKCPSELLSTHRTMSNDNELLFQVITFGVVYFVVVSRMLTNTNLSTGPWSHAGPRWTENLPLYNFPSHPQTQSNSLLVLVLPSLSSSVKALDKGFSICSAPSPDHFTSKMGQVSMVWGLNWKQLGEM